MRKAWNKGKKMSVEQREKLREARLRNPVRYWLGKKSPYSGARHWNWQGGITPLVIKVRRCSEYRRWASNVLKRDDFTCQKCLVRGGDLEADHYPKTFSQIFHENIVKTFEAALECSDFWNLGNGRTLCKECHKSTFKNKKKNAWK